MGAGKDIIVTDGEKGGKEARVINGRLLVDGAGGGAVPVPLPVTDNGGSLTVDDGGLTLSIDDGGGSLTIDGTVATGYQRAEDSAHVSGHNGAFVLGVRNDALAARTNADGDYSPISVDSRGIVWVRSMDLKTPLTASANGRPIAVNANASPGTLLETVPALAAGTAYAYFLKASYVNNGATGAEDAFLTVEFGGVLASDQQRYYIPLEDAVVVIAGDILNQAGLVIRAFHNRVGDVVNIIGYKQLVLT